MAPRAGRPPAPRRGPGAFGIASPLVTLGVQPTRPATEYGYLRPDVARAAEAGGLRASPLEAFEEEFLFPEKGEVEAVVQAEDEGAWARFERWLAEMRNCG